MTLKIVRTYLITTLQSDNNVKTDIIESDLLKIEFLKTIKKPILFFMELAWHPNIFLLYYSC